MSTPDWQWTDEDSRDLDERNRRMRKPKRYVPPITSKDAQALASRPVTTLESPLRSGRRIGQAMDAPENKARVWERTKQQLMAAGVRPVETPPAQSTADAQPRMAKRRSKRTPITTKRTPRECLDCGGDISSRGKTAVRCKEHAYVHGRALARARTAKATKENQQ